MASGGRKRDDEPDDDWVDDPAAAAMNLEQNTSPVRTVKISATFKVWLEKKRKQHPTRKSWAPVKKALKEFCRTNRIVYFRGMRVEQIDRFIESRLGRRDYSQTHLRQEVGYIQSFFRWACRRHRLTNPYANFAWEDCVQTGSTDRVRPRRALSFEEWDWLQRITLQKDVPRRRITAAVRVLLYRTVLQAGFRGVECSRLRVMDLHVGAAPEKDGETCNLKDPSYLDLPGRPVRGRDASRRTKNQKPARQYIQHQLAVDLLAMVRRRESGWHEMLRRPDNPLFKASKKWWANVAKILAADLTLARVEYLCEMQKLDLPADPNFLAVQDDNGEVLDFHSLRHTCGAWVAHFTKDPHTVMRVMRHSSIDMTFGVYGHMLPDRKVEAVGKLPNV